MHLLKKDLRALAREARQQIDHARLVEPRRALGAGNGWSDVHFGAPVWVDDGDAASQAVIDADDRVHGLSSRLMCASGNSSINIFSSILSSSVWYGSLSAHSWASAGHHGAQQTVSPASGQT